MKTMTKKEFMQQYIYGFKNFMSHRQIKYSTSEIEYCPAHTIMDLKFNYKFPCIMLYNKSKDVTYLFIQCTGLINLDFCNDNKEGDLFIFKGDRRNDLVEDHLLKSKKFLNYLNSKYDQYEREIREEISAEANKEEI